MSEIKCIVFDWGGVLIDNPVEDFALECSKRLGVGIESLKNSYSKFALQFEKGILSETELWQKMSVMLSITISNSNSLWYDCFNKVYSPRISVFELAKSLKNEGYKIALLSNTEIPTMIFFFEQQYDFFDTTVFSCAEGYVKPEHEIYHILINKLQLPANQLLFIDDRQKNVTNAQKIGMNGIVYRNLSQLLEELRKYRTIK